MYRYVNDERLNHTDLNIYHCGTEDCVPGHSYGPAVRDHYLIHYILKGKGFFEAEGVTYHLEKGQGFLICPNQVTYYQADFENPWSYSWVGFHGLKAELYLKRANLTLENPIFRYDKDDFIKNCFDEMISSLEMKNAREIKLVGLLYIFLSQLIEVNSKENFKKWGGERKEFYVKNTIDFIQTNYSRSINVSEIAKFIGLDRSYLCSLFKEYLNSSIQEFLINFRINKACELMKNDLLSIGDIARSVGYQDPLLFSKIFKKVKGLSPREYRKSIISS